VVGIVGAVARRESDRFEITARVAGVDLSPRSVDPSVVVDIGVAAIADLVVIRVALCGIGNVEAIVSFVGDPVCVEIAAQIL